MDSLFDIISWIFFFYFKIFYKTQPYWGKQYSVFSYEPSFMVSEYTFEVINSSESINNPSFVVPQPEICHPEPVSRTLRPYMNNSRPQSRLPKPQTIYPEPQMMLYNLRTFAKKSPGLKSGASILC